LPPVAVAVAVAVALPPLPDGPQQLPPAPPPYALLEALAGPEAEVAVAVVAALPPGGRAAHGVGQAYVATIPGRGAETAIAALRTGSDVDGAATGDAFSRGSGAAAVRAERAAYDEAAAAAPADRHS
jgi:hypothetical protein